MSWKHQNLICRSLDHDRESVADCNGRRWNKAVRTGTRLILDRWLTL